MLGIRMINLGEDCKIMMLIWDNLDKIVIEKLLSIRIRPRLWYRKFRDSTKLCQEKISKFNSSWGKLKNISYLLLKKARPKWKIGLSMRTTSIILKDKTNKWGESFYSMGIWTKKSTSFLQTWNKQVNNTSEQPWSSKTKVKNTLV